MTTPAWISHRGRCFNGVENTLSAFRFAQSVGYEHFETDLRCTRDGHIVLCHDSNLAAMSSHPQAYVPIRQQSLKKLKSIPLRDGQNIATLAEIMDEFSQYRWIFDIKPETASEVVHALIHHWWHTDFSWFFCQQVRFLFWQKKPQMHLHMHRKQAHFMAPSTHCWRAGISCLMRCNPFGCIQKNKTYALPATLGPISLFRPQNIQFYHQAGAQVLAYLPRSSSECTAALTAGVDEILSDGLPYSPYVA